ncbi:sulfotransferase family protein [Roseiconus nitratireducens]|nr:sulfotransferase [Roseiconus nitratireducens]
MNHHPDFIIIGGMKCMTSTLHSQLESRSGFCMSEPKEPCYFSDDPVFQLGPEWYSQCWSSPNPGDLLGESSTHYTKLPTYPQTIERIRQTCPDVKLIYVMRHPIDRLVSQYVHEWTVGQVTDPIDRAIETFPELIQYSRYEYQIAPFIEAFGPTQVLPIFFDRLRRHPESELQRIFAFLRAPGVPIWRRDLPSQNIGHERMRTSPWRDRIVYAPGISWVRKSLIPRPVRERVKALWRLRDRPKLSEDSVAKLTEIFNHDLDLLSQRLGIDPALTCRNFERTAELDLPLGFCDGDGLTEPASGTAVSDRISDSTWDSK